MGKRVYEYDLGDAVWEWIKPLVVRGKRHDPKSRVDERLEHFAVEESVHGLAAKIICFNMHKIIENIK